MSLELVRESIKVSRIIGQDSAQTIVENDIIVPDVKPDIANILVLDGDVSVSSTEVLQDKLLINGIIRYKILYVSDNPDQPVKGINTAVNFSSGLDIQNAKHGMNSRAKCEIEHIDYEILNGRKVNIKAILSVSGKVMEVNEQDISSDLRGLDDIQVLKDNAIIESYVGDTEVSCTVREELQVPAGKPTIAEILRSDLKITAGEYKIADNKVIVNGELNISTLYLGDDTDRSIQFMEHEIPFSQAVEIENITETAKCHIEYRVLDSQFTEAEDGDGELRVLNTDVAVGIYISAYESKNVEMIADAYSPKAKLSLERAQIKMEEAVAESKGQATVKDSVTVEEGKPEISQVFNVLSKPVLSECTLQDGKVTVEGVVNNKVIYLAVNSEQQIYCIEQEMPFKHTLDIKDIANDMQPEVELDIDHCNYSMLSGTEVEIRLVVGVTAKVISQTVIPVISKVNEAPIDDKRIIAAPSITIYFAQPEDTLWKIAKKYYTTVIDLARVNSLSDSDEVAVGQQIIIPRYKL